MTSKIKIALDEKRAPVIALNYVPSDDLRDDVLKKFLEQFKGISRWAEMKYIEQTNDGACKVIISPIVPSDLLYSLKDMIRYAWTEYNYDQSTRIFHEDSKRIGFAQYLYNEIGFELFNSDNIKQFEEAATLRGLAPSVS